MFFSQRLSLHQDEKMKMSWIDEHCYARMPIFGPDE